MRFEGIASSRRTAVSHGIRSGVRAPLTVALIAASLLSVVGTAPFGRARPAPPPENVSPPGQVQVLTVNARQQEILDLATFRRLFELVRAMRNRPTAFNGVGGATAMPDAILFQEMKFSNLEIAKKLLQQRSSFDYEIVAPEGAMTRMLVNVSTMTIAEEARTILDPCRDGSDGSPPKSYQAIRLTEQATGAPVTMVNVHLKAKYAETGQSRCRERNVEAIRAALANEVGPVIIGGDFNSRPVTSQHECDPDAQSVPLEWWTSLTAPTDGGRPYVDAVLTTHRGTGEGMGEEWTFERSGQATLCNARLGLKRSRLDYLFAAGTVVADAHVDHPGWAGRDPGTFDPLSFKYSDHRWVQGRFVISGPLQPLPPTVSPVRAGSIDVVWQPQEGVTSWVLYRAVGDRPYRALTAVGSEVTSFRDSTTRHGVAYGYAVTPVGADSGHGLESAPAFAIADARGPRVIGRRPRDGATDVPRRADVEVFFDERIDPESVDVNTLRLFRKGRRVAGTIRMVSRRHILFNPFNLRRKSTYWVVVGPVLDPLGNPGPRDVFSFRT
ncbi:MAG: Ig-like domain-containing protein [Actinomycetota bacterium]|nr:Ig-like domain-containing protein [Actinomycetota bacterium]